MGAMGRAKVEGKTMIATAIQATVCIAAIGAAMSDAREHTRATPLYRRLLTLMVGGAAAIMFAAVIGSWAPVVTSVSHRIIDAGPGWVVFEWSANKARWASEYERAGVAVYLTGSDGVRRVATRIDFSESTGGIPRASGQQSFGEWTAYTVAGICPTDVSIRAIHHGPYSIRANVTDLGPWPVDVECR